MKSIMKKILALILLVGGTWLLWWNERVSASVAGAIGEARPATIKLVDVMKADRAFHGKMIHATGLADTKDIITDPFTGAYATAIRLDRKVQYYQWTESKHSRTRTIGNKEEEVITYTYAKRWSDRPINSSYFYDRAYDKNVVLMDAVPNETFYAPNVTFGAYNLSPAITASIPGPVSIDVVLNAEVSAKLEAQITPPSVLAAGRSYVHRVRNTIHLGRTPASPEIGDIRVIYTAVLPANISVLAQVAGNSLEPFKASSGGTFSRVYTGDVGMEEMYGNAESENTTNMWIRRAMGALFVCFGVKLAGKLRALVAFPAGLAWSLLVIGAALLV